VVYFRSWIVMECVLKPLWLERRTEEFCDQKSYHEVNDNWYTLR